MSASLGPGSQACDGGTTPPPAGNHRYTSRCLATVGHRRHSHTAATGSAPPSEAAAAMVPCAASGKANPLSWRCGQPARGGARSGRGRPRRPSERSPPCAPPNACFPFGAHARARETGYPPFSRSRWDQRLRRPIRPANSSTKAELSPGSRRCRRRRPCPGLSPPRPFGRRPAMARRCVGKHHISRGPFRRADGTSR